MQDKEFDQLFNSKLSDFEIEPSAEVWQNINRELNGKKAKRSIIPYLSIAASVIVLASVSLWFFNQHQEKTKQHPVKLVKRVKPFNPQPGVNESGAPAGIVKDRLAEVIDAGIKTKTGSGLNKPQIIEQMPQETTIALPEAIVEKPAPVLAVAPAQRAPVLQPAVPANDVPLSTGLLADNSVEYIEKSVDAVKDAPVTEKPAVKKRAHGLGGLINTIIAAVDKREDKLIEFTDANDDEGSTVTGVNLGIFKIKKQ